MSLRLDSYFRSLLAAAEAMAATGASAMHIVELIRAHGTTGPVGRSYICDTCGATALYTSDPQNGGKADGQV
jgi:hypothetical protein